MAVDEADWTVSTAMLAFAVSGEADLTVSTVTLVMTLVISLRSIRRGRLDSFNTGFSALLGSWQCPAARQI
jgi:hypothetical protein